MNAIPISARSQADQRFLAALRRLVENGWDIYWDTLQVRCQFIGSIVVSVPVDVMRVYHLLCLKIWPVRQRMPDGSTSAGAHAYSIPGVAVQREGGDARKPRAAGGHERRAGLGCREKMPWIGET